MEKRVFTYGMSYDAVVAHLKSIDEETAERFIKEEDTYFEFRYGNDYIVADCDYVDSDWEGSDDY